MWGVVVLKDSLVIPISSSCPHFIYLDAASFDAVLYAKDH